jgi:hypothetical protein
VLEQLAACGRAASRTDLFQAGGRTFLEVERFDGVGLSGRRGLVSMAALDAEFVGSFAGWIPRPWDCARPV